MFKDQCHPGPVGHLCWTCHQFVCWGWTWYLLVKFHICSSPSDYIGGDISKTWSRSCDNSCGGQPSKSRSIICKQRKAQWRAKSEELLQSKSNSWGSTSLDLHEMEKETAKLHDEGDKSAGWQLILTQSAVASSLCQGWHTLIDYDHWQWRWPCCGFLEWESSGMQDPHGSTGVALLLWCFLPSWAKGSHLSVGQRGSGVLLSQYEPTSRVGPGSSWHT